MPMPIVSLGGDDSGDRGTVLLGDKSLPADEVAVDRHLSRKVRMAGIDATVDDCHGRAATAGDPVQVGEMPLRRGRLGGVKRVVMGGAARRIELRRLGPFDIGIVRNQLGHGLGRAALRHNHHKAVDADHRHRPIIGEGQAILVRDAPGEVLPRAARKLVAVAAAVPAGRPVMVERVTYHDQDLAVGRNACAIHRRRRRKRR